MQALRFLKRIPAKAILLGVLALLLTFTAGAFGAPAQPRNLNIFSVGIAECIGQSPLPSCKKDAIDMNQWARSQKGKLFQDVQDSILLNADATRANVLNGLQGLKAKAQPGDYTMVYLSSHGGIHQGELKFCAYDGVVSWSEVQDALRDVPGTVIVILDVCHAGAIKSGGNLIVISSSLADQGSYAGDATHNSKFTEYLLAGLNGAADMNKNGVVSLAELDAYMSGCLENFNAKRPNSKPQDSTILRPANVPSALPLAKLAAAPVAQAPVAPAPVAQVQVQNLAGTTWTGSENLNGYGKLTFKFLANGKAVMIDSQSTVQGSYTMTGNQVTIQLPGVAVYQGTINGDAFTGTGKDDTRTWSFNVTKTK